MTTYVTCVRLSKENIISTVICTPVCTFLPGQHCTADGNRCIIHDIVNEKLLESRIKVKGKAIPVTGRGGPQGCETSRLPHLLDNRLTDSCKLVSLTRRPLFTPQEDSWYSFLLEAESIPGP
jgi:hypothetical protein